jgi:uncharacterized protein
MIPYFGGETDHASTDVGGRSPRDGRCLATVSARCGRGKKSTRCDKAGALIEMEDPMGDTIVWADIPVVDITRASAFYAAVTGGAVMPMPGAETEVALLMSPDGVGGVSADLYVGGTPSKEGATVYLNTWGDIDAVLARVSGAGGTVLQDKQFMGPMVGWVAFIEDTEGNRIGLQQPAEEK